MEVGHISQTWKRQLTRGEVLHFDSDKMIEQEVEAQGQGEKSHKQERERGHEKFSDPYMKLN